MTIHSSLLGISETELRNMIWSLVPSWRDDGLEDFHFLSGGYSNRDSMISSGSNHSDRDPGASVSSLALASGPPPPLLPPKHGIGREGSEGPESNNGIEQ